MSRHNKGISHCGIHPSLLPLSIIRCDVFHMGCSIGRRLIDYLRMFSRETGYDFECKLANILNKVWSENVMCLWRLNKKTSKLLGTEIKAFVLKCPDIVKLMRTKEGGFVQTQESIALARGLELWHHIEAHLKRAEVEKKDVDGFPNVLKQFEKNIDQFYDCGTETYLSGKWVNVGDDETYYLHALKFYIPVHARDVWRLHKCGIGVFTMQGFERRNKESKNILRRFNNQKHNICSQILKRLWDCFYYNNDHINKTKKEIVDDIVDDLLREDNNDGDEKGFV